MVVNISHILSHSSLRITLSALSNLFLFRCSPWPESGDFVSPVSTHLVPITPTPGVHFIISPPPPPPLPLHVHLLIPHRYIVMPMSKRHTIKGTTWNVAPKPHSPHAAPDVAKKGCKPPRICENIQWSPSKVVWQKMAPLPDTTIDLTHSKETSPPSSSN